ncbi:MAG: hypothetical protein GY865_15625 [candidate division Zixibacteria bacterium]|nr:hypothetical protein [candidate division Zixibacteria bacterium]
MPHLRVKFYLIIIVLMCTTVFGAQKTYVNEEVISRLKIHNGPIVSLSDSLFLNNKKLNRDVDYRIDYFSGIVTLQNYQPQFIDSLKIFFTPLPNWLRKMYGVQPEHTDRTTITPTNRFKPNEPLINSAISSKLQISGAKKFSILSETIGSSRFDQSLELSIKGELSPGLQISGSVSDREYYSSYGSINSTISELDKINLKIESKHFISEIGDLEIRQQSDFGQSDVKQVSGLEVAYKSKKMSMLATVARPRGRQETIRFSGRDLVQGPYRICVGSSIHPIIPGSEKVWFNGQLLEKGAEKDYSIDYSLATITFSPKVPVDSRSRVEVDFEPLNDSYQKEYYRFQTGLVSSDSVILFEFGYLHEGDNKNRLKTGELSAESKILLEGIGGNSELAWSDGAVPDSAGNYVERFDTGNNQYFEYVGDSQGDYSVRFSPVGENKGEYQYVGAGIYHYVGFGFGEYLPQVSIPIPIKEDYFNAGLLFKPAENSQVSLKIHQSLYDRNLFSTLDDNNNTDGKYIFSGRYGALPNLNSKQFGLSINADYTGKHYKFYTRKNIPDLERKYLIPDSLDILEDKIEVSTASSIILPTPYSILISGAILDLKNKFNSGYGEISIYPNSENSLFPTVSYRRLRADLDTSGVSYKGKGDTYDASWKYLISNSTEIKAAYNQSRRSNHYFSGKQGTTERQYNIAIKYKSAELRYEKYDEDTLVNNWQNQIKRNRIILAYNGKISGIKSNIYLTAQKLRQNQIDQNQLMAQIKYSYTPSISNLSIGGSYSLSDESRYERGLNYIEVEPGFGKFIFEDSQYIPDQFGDHIKVEEILSNQATVKKGERSFDLFYNPKDIYIRLGSNITEELLANGKRGALWIIPFLSDGKESYLYRRLNYKSDIKMIRYSGYYIINLSGSYKYESRRVGGADFEKYEQVFKTTIREKAGRWHFSQEGSYFKYQRDSYYLSAGNIDGYKIKADVIRYFGGSQVNSELYFRSARDKSGSKSKQLSVKIVPALRFANRGETVISVMGYFQELDGGDKYSYRLTENLSGKKGGVWSLRSEYRVGSDIKFVVSFGGRFSDDRKPRTTGRGELIASF